MVEHAEKKPMSIKPWLMKKKKNRGHLPNDNKIVPQANKFKGGKSELEGHHFDCVGYGQTDRFIKTVHKIADYVGQEYKNGGTTRTEIMTQEHVTINPPTRPRATTTTATDGSVTTTQPDAIDISDYQSQKKIIDYLISQQWENRQKVYSLVWQQCTDTLHAKIKSMSVFSTIEAALDGIALLKAIKLICFNIEDEKYVPQKVHESKAAFYALKQGKDSDQVYQVKFTNVLQVIEQCGASLGEDPLTHKMVAKSLGFSETTKVAAEIEAIAKSVREYTLGVAFILGADPERYGNLVRGLKNASLAGRDEWPKSMTEAYNYLAKWECDESRSREVPEYVGNQFMTADDSSPKEPKPWHAKMTCRNCNKLGHIAAFCKETGVALTTVLTSAAAKGEEEAVMELIDGQETDVNDAYYADLFLTETEESQSMSFQTSTDGINGGRIPKTWVLLDNQSTTDAFSNPDLLTNIHEVEGSLTIHTQTGKAVTKLRGTVPGYGEVWYCPDGIANILSLANVAKTRTVEYSSSNGNEFMVKKNDGTTRVFKQSKNGLYYFDMSVPVADE